MKNILTLLLISFVLSACTSLSIEDCATINWQQRGYDEAKRGFSLKQYQEYVEECRDVGGVIPSKSEYSAGHYRGAQEFCTAISGYAYGKSGSHYNGSCKEWDLDDYGFIKGYHAGQELYAAEKNIDSAIHELEEHRAAMDDAQYQIRHNTDRLSDRSLTQSEVSTIQIEIEKQRSRYGDLYRTENSYEEDIEQARRELEYIILKHQRLNYCDYEGCF